MTAPFPFVPAFPMMGEWRQTTAVLYSTSSWCLWCSTLALSLPLPATLHARTHVVMCTLLLNAFCLTTSTSATSCRLLLLLQDCAHEVRNTGLCAQRQQQLGRYYWLLSTRQLCQ